MRECSEREEEGPESRVIKWGEREATVRGVREL